MKGCVVNAPHHSRSSVRESLPRISAYHLGLGTCRRHGRSSVKSQVLRSTLSTCTQLESTPSCPCTVLQFTASITWWDMAGIGFLRRPPTKRGMGAQTQTCQSALKKRIQAYMLHAGYVWVYVVHKDLLSMSAQWVAATFNSSIHHCISAFVPTFLTLLALITTSAHASSYVNKNDIKFGISVAYWVMHTGVVNGLHCRFCVAFGCEAKVGRSERHALLLDSLGLFCFKTTTLKTMFAPSTHWNGLSLGRPR